jgi:hypothetical protein
MEEKDTVQSQLNCLLKSDVDDHVDDRTAKRWVLILTYTYFTFCITVLWDI